MLTLAKQTMLMLCSLFRDAPIGFSFHVSVGLTCVLPLKCVYMCLQRKGPSAYTQYKKLKQIIEYGSYYILALILLFSIEDKGCCNGRRRGRFGGGEVGRH